MDNLSGGVIDEDVTVVSIPDPYNVPDHTVHSHTPGVGQAPPVPDTGIVKVLQEIVMKHWREILHYPLHKIYIHIHTQRGFKSNRENTRVCERRDSERRDCERSIIMREEILREDIARKRLL